ncbi:lipase family protein [Actinokineospora soli]|uniref:Lipase family protein n=1 Tax=Actinokineospora soli TaxID=1048753 RepID=A0ABW2TUV8_9PSEU
MRGGDHRDPHRGGTAVAADDVYTAPVPLPAGQPGDVIKSAPASFNGATATKVQYLTRDAKDQAVAVSGLVLVPTAPWTGPGQRPIVGFAPFTFGMGAQCAPSKTLTGQGGDIVSSVQGQFVSALLGKGFAVAQTDYIGPWVSGQGEHPYVMRASAGRAVLDGIRAAQRLPGGNLPTGGPVGVYGYSEGGGGAAAAIELASTYAPELKMVAGYAGAPPADLHVLSSSLDGGFYAAFLGFALIGIHRTYPEAGMLDLANQKGAQMFVEASKTCTMDAVFKFSFTQTSTLTKSGKPVSSFIAQEPFKSIVAQNRLGTVKPAAPMLVESSPMDDVIPNKVVKQLVADWCGQGGTVKYQDLTTFSPFFSHVMGAFSGMGSGANYLADRFAGKPAPNSC